MAVRVQDTTDAVQEASFFPELSNLPSLCDYDIPLMAFLGGNSIQMYKLNFVIRTLLLLLITSYHKCVSGAEVFAPHTGGSS